MTKHKKRRLLDKIEELEPQFNKHLKKLDEAKKAGGYISSIEKELRAWRYKKDEIKGRS
jgi:uncharacterized coiled-coil DUF342 family protein